jgi:formylglycine-generating enzyme required for sulfatase activity
MRCDGVNMAIVAAACGALIAAGSQALAQMPPSYGLDFVPVGAAGNRPTNPGDVPWQPELRIGSVPYEFRITRTEVTVGEWYEFVMAYLPFYSGPNFNSRFTGSRIIWDGERYVRGTPNFPTDPAFHYIARYVNWLHNGKVNQRWAFEDGVYDTSTFTTNPNGTRNDQIGRRPGARFWIPSEDEWTKAAYFDPNKNGPGQEGYWLYPNRSDERAIPGLPGTGGTTNAGLPPPYIMPVGSYPNAVSPWGLLDTSGSMDEVLETVQDTIRRERLTRATRWGGDRAFLFMDRIDYSGFSTAIPEASNIGFRIVSVVPSPGGVMLVGMVGIGALCIRRRAGSCKEN